MFLDVLDDCKYDFSVIDNVLIRFVDCGMWLMLWVYVYSLCCKVFYLDGINIVIFDWECVIVSINISYLGLVIDFLIGVV